VVAVLECVATKFFQTQYWLAFKKIFLPTYLYKESNDKLKQNEYKQGNTNDYC
jgi:hypothetical protein